jgi:fumarylacetoacetase
MWSTSGTPQGKRFATSVFPWVVPLAALEHAHVPLPGQDPAPLSPTRGAGRDWSLDVDLTAEWNGEEVSHPPYRTMH